MNTFHSVTVVLQDGNKKQLIDQLPHGSGIDLKWELEVNERWIVCRNGYHCMSDNGFYDGWIDFTVKLPRYVSPKEWKTEFVFQINGKDSHYNATKYYGTRDYLEETFNYALCDIVEASVTVTTL